MANNLITAMHAGCATVANRQHYATGFAKRYLLYTFDILHQQTVTDDCY